jgi:hypothetical protein
MSADLLRQTLAQLAESDLNLLGETRRRSLLNALHSAAKEIDARRASRARQEIEADVIPEDRALYKRLVAGARRPPKNAPEAVVQAYLEKLRSAALECRRLSEKYSTLLEGLRRAPYDAALESLHELSAADRRRLNLLSNVTGSDGQPLPLRAHRGAPASRPPSDADREWLTELRRGRTSGALSREPRQTGSPRPRSRRGGRLRRPSA